MVNYADLMTELVCFFIILYALSAALNKNVREVKTQVEAVMAKEHLEGAVKVKKDGVEIALQEGEKLSFFESGKATLSQDGLKVLDKISPVLSEAKGEIIVEGHTDNVPVRNPQGFSSNWELSTARATNVVRYLIQERKFRPERLAAIGYGEHRPLASNGTASGRAKNRRVVFFIKTGTGAENDRVATKNEGKH